MCPDLKPLAFSQLDPPGPIPCSPWRLEHMLLPGQQGASSEHGCGPRGCSGPSPRAGLGVHRQERRPPFYTQEVEVCRWEEAELGEAVSLAGKPCSAGVGVPGRCPQGEPGATDSTALLSSGPPQSAEEVGIMTSPCCACQGQLTTTGPGRRKDSRSDSRDLPCGHWGLAQLRLGCPIFCKKKSLFIFLISNTGGVEARE